MHGTGGGGAGLPWRLEWRRGWPLILSALVGYGTSGVYAHTFGVFIEPLQQEFGWSRSAVTGGMMVAAIVAGGGAPIIGRMVDRFGSRPIALGGMALFCLSLGLLGTSSSAVWHWWALWGLLACGIMCIAPTVWVAAISHAFTTTRGLAMATAMTGSGIFASVVPTIATLLIDSSGWRSAYWIMASCLAALNLPLLYLCFARRRRPASSEAEPAPAKPEGFAVRESMCSRRFVQLCGIAFLITSATYGMQVHFVPLLTSFHVSRIEAAAAAGLIGIGSITGRLVTGFLLDRIPGPIVGAMAFCLPIVASLLVLTEGEGHMLALGSLVAFIYGTALGAELDILAYLTSRYFGLRNYGTLIGAQMALVGLAVGTGPMIGSMMYDLAGNYVAFLWLNIAAFAVGAVLVGTLGRYPRSFEPLGAERAGAAD